MRGCETEKGQRRRGGTERYQWELLTAGRECCEIVFEERRRARRRLTRHDLLGLGRGWRGRIFVRWLVPTVKVRDAGHIGEAKCVEGLRGDAVLGGLSSSATSRKASCLKWRRRWSHVDCHARITGLGGGCASEDEGGVGRDVGPGRDVVSGTGRTTETLGTEAEAEEKWGGAGTSSSGT